MFKVGMGNLPRIPDTLSSEGQEFLAHCLQFNPDHRWTASQLKGHLFVSVSKRLWHHVSTCIKLSARSSVVYHTPHTHTRITALSPGLPR